MELARLDPGDEEITNPLTYLLRRTTEADRWLTQAREQVQRLLDRDDLTFMTDHGEEVRAMIKVYERALERTAVFADRIAKLNIDHRITAILERDMELVERAFEVIYQSALDGKTLDQARADAARRLVLVQS